MGFHRTTSKGIGDWILTLINQNNYWSSTDVAQGLTEDVLEMVTKDFQLYDHRVRQSILVSILFIDKQTMCTSMNYLQKLIEVSVRGSHDFTKSIAYIVKPSLTAKGYQTDNYPLDSKLARQLCKNAIHFHALEESIMQRNAIDYRCEAKDDSTLSHDLSRAKSQHFMLSSRKEDIIDSDERQSRFKKVLEEEDSVNFIRRRSATDLHFNNRGFKTLPSAQSSFYSAGRSVMSASTSSNSISLDNVHPVSSSGIFATPRRNNKFNPQGNFSSSSSSTRPALNQSDLPKGFQRSTKVQMIDFEEVSQIQKTCTDEIEKAKRDRKCLETEKRIRRNHELKRGDRFNFSPNAPYARRSAGRIKSAPTKMVQETPAVKLVYF